MRSFLLTAAAAAAAIALAANAACSPFEEADSATVMGELRRRDAGLPGACATPWHTSKISTDAQVISTTQWDLAAAGDATGALHVATFDQAVVRARYFKRQPNGAWTSEPLGPGLGDVGVGVALAVDASNGVHIAHGLGRYARRSVAGTFTDEATDDLLLAPAIATTPDGAVHITGYRTNDRTMWLRYARRSPTGAWSHEDAVSLGAAWLYGSAPFYAASPRGTALSVDDAGAVRALVGTKDDSGTFRLALATRGPVGWSLQAVGVGRSGAMVREPSGRLALGYLDADAHLVSEYRGAAGQLLASVVVDATSTLPAATSLALDAVGRRHLTYTADANGTPTVRYAVVTGGAAASSEDVDPDRFSAALPPTTSQLVVDANGDPHIFFTRRGGLYVAERCR